MTDLEVPSLVECALTKIAAKGSKGLSVYKLTKDERNAVRNSGLVEYRFQIRWKPVPWDDIMVRLTDAGQRILQQHSQGGN